MKRLLTYAMLCIAMSTNAQTTYSYSARKGQILSTTNGETTTVETAPVKSCGCFCSNAGQAKTAVAIMNAGYGTMVTYESEVSTSEVANWKETTTNYYTNQAWYWKDGEWVIAGTFITPLSYDTTINYWAYWLAISAFILLILVSIIKRIKASKPIKVRSK